MGAISKSGTLVSKVTSTASSPNVNYKLTYVSTRASGSDKNVSVKLTISTRLTSSGSKLGTGIKLTAFARINGGSWSSVALKSTSAAWSGTETHTAVLTLNASTTGASAKVDFYVSRSGSTYSGSAGVLGSSGSPKSYAASLPEYTDGGSTTPPQPDIPTEKYVYININGVWKKAVPYVHANGTWKKAEAYVNSGGVWKGMKST